MGKSRLDNGGGVSRIPRGGRRGQIQKKKTIPQLAYPIRKGRRKRKQKRKISYEGRDTHGAKAHWEPMRPSTAIVVTHEK